MVEYKRIKDLREDHDYTQDYIANYLETNRSSYANWESGDNLIPLDKLDMLSVFYNVPFSYLLGIKNKFDKNIKIKKIDYDKLLENLNNYRNELNLTYQQIADYLKVSKATAFKYYNDQLTIPTDALVLLSELNKCDIDELCNKI